MMEYTNASASSAARSASLVVDFANRVAPSVINTTTLRPLRAPHEEPLSLAICRVSTLCFDGSARTEEQVPATGVDGSETKTGQNEPTMQKRIDLVLVQREADVLARTAQTIPSGVANVSKGTLPKDVIEKLKQIERLSKHLRSELNP